MSDIFISYSSKDRAQADQLIQLLGSAGLSVWIDKSGIEAATSWSKEIVQAINECKAFVVLLSPNSLLSNNVIKEVSLASEKRKKILPLDLEPVQLTEDFEYQLAGLQHASMTNIDAVIRALAKLGLEATGAPQPPKIVKETDARKSLMILPFEDLSPTGDNGWFADGIVSELISALSNVKALRTMDAQTTKEFKGFKGHLTTYASEMKIRYFVQGDVRKFGDQIKISSRLLDIETGDHLWQDSMKGTMDNIFDLQEQVAKKVLDGLKVHLTSAEFKKLEQRTTDNIEAYELYMRAREQYDLLRKVGHEQAVALLRQAIALDPSFVAAYRLLAQALVQISRIYDTDNTRAVEAEGYAEQALRLDPDMHEIYYTLANIYGKLHKMEMAKTAALEAVRRAPHDPQSHFSLAYYYVDIGEPNEAIAPLEEALRLDPEFKLAYWLYQRAHWRAGGALARRSAAERALPVFTRWVNLHPDDETARVWFAYLLQFAGRNEDAITVLLPLRDRKNLDARSSYNLACLHANQGLFEDAMQFLTAAISAGFANYGVLVSDEDLDPLRERNDFRLLVKKLEAKLNA